MGRAYVCPIIGTGTEEDPYRAQIRDIPGIGRVRAMISSNTASGPGQGTPRNNWAACWVEQAVQTANPDTWTPADDDPALWATVDADQANVFLGDFPLDDPAPTQVIQRARQRGFLTQQEANSVSGGTFRDLLNLIVRKHYPNASAEDLLVGAV